MKKFAALLLSAFSFQLFSVSALAAIHAQYFFTDTQLVPAGVKSVTLTPFAPFTVSGTNLVTGDSITRKVNSLGSITISNLIPGNYLVEFAGATRNTVFTNSFGTNVSGLVNGADYLVISTNLPDGNLAYSKAQADAKFALLGSSGGGGVTNNQVLPGTPVGLGMGFTNAAGSQFAPTNLATLLMANLSSPTFSGNTATSSVSILFNGAVGPVFNTGGYLLEQVNPGISTNLLFGAGVATGRATLDPLGTFTAVKLAGDASLVTGLASNNLSGKINPAQIFPAVSSATTNQFAATNDPRSLSLTNAANVFAGAFSGNGAGVTNLNASLVSNGVVSSSDLRTSARSVAMEAQKPPLFYSYPFYATWGTNNTEDTVTGVAAGGVQTNIYGTISEYVLLAMATNAVNDGLVALGYNWADSGPGWSAATRDGSDNIRADPARFPNGINYTRGLLNKMGIRLGLWAELGNTNSAGLPGGGTDWNHVYQDARFYAGNDLLRWDYDSFPIDPDSMDLGKRALAEAFLYALRTNNSGVLTYMHNNKGTGIGVWTNGYNAWMGQSLNFWMFTDANGTPDAASWETNIRWIDGVDRFRGDLRLGHKVSSIPIDTGPLLDATYSGHNGRLMVSMLALYQGPLVFRANLVAFKRYFNALTPPQTAPNPDFQTNVWMIGIHQNDDPSPPWKSYTNGTIEVRSKTLRANPRIGATAPGALWPDGSIAYMVINRGYASNVLGNSLSIPVKYLGLATNSTASASFQNVWEHTNVVLNGQQSWAISAETNTCSLWVMSPVYNSTAVTYATISSNFIPAQLLISNGLVLSLKEDASSYLTVTTGASVTNNSSAATFVTVSNVPANGNTVFCAISTEDDNGNLGAGIAKYGGVPMTLLLHTNFAGFFVNDVFVLTNAAGTAEIVYTNNVAAASYGMAMSAVVLTNYGSAPSYAMQAQTYNTLVKTATNSAVTTLASDLALDVVFTVDGSQTWNSASGQTRLGAANTSNKPGIVLFQTAGNGGTLISAVTNAINSYPALLTMVLRGPVVPATVSGNAATLTNLNAAASNLIPLGKNFSFSLTNSVSATNGVGASNKGITLLVTNGIVVGFTSP